MIFGSLRKLGWIRAAEVKSAAIADMQLYCSIVALAVTCAGFDTAVTPKLPRLESIADQSLARGGVG